MPRATAPTDWAACERELAAGAAALGLELGTGVRARLLDYLAELANWNATHNLTAVREPRAMVARHLLDSLAVLEAVTGPRLADVGTGAGLPGLVIALARPEIAVTLIESSAKKAAITHQGWREARRPMLMSIFSRASWARAPRPLSESRVVGRYDRITGMMATANASATATPRARVIPKVRSGGNGENEFARNANTVVTTARESAIRRSMNAFAHASAALSESSLALS